MINHKHVVILETLEYLSKKYGKNYCYPRQKTIIELVQKIHNIKLSLRTLNRYLRFLVDHGFIHRIRRHTHMQALGFYFRSSAYYVLDRTQAAVSRIKSHIGAILPGATLYPFISRVPIMANNKDYIDDKRTKELSLEAFSFVEQLKMRFSR